MKGQVINADSIHKNLDELLPPARIPEIKPLVKLASQVVAGRNVRTVRLNLPEEPSKPSWDKNYMTSVRAAECQKILLEPDTILHLRCPLWINNKRGGGAASASCFDIYLAKDVSDLSLKPRFIREGITIPEDRVPKVRGFISLVVIESGPLATLLGDSENPAHTEWEKNATRFKGKYQWGPSTIDFVRLSVGKALNLMSQGDEEEDFTVLSDIFYLEHPEDDDEVPDQRRKKKKKDDGEQPEPSPPQPPEPRPRHYRLSKVEKGFVLRGPSEPLKSPRSYTITVAYDFAGASKASALKKYHRNDFALDTARYVDPPQAHNTENLELGGNTIAFSASANDFEVRVEGFDPDRDIVVDVKSEALETDETI
ncbi:hypothetical protein [Marinobacter sp. F4216]|uniref:hypothetical protein n=1 Tax=Marinobacter sp. F4216 TaxID=2874281 RepID=UPI001CC146BB|nr:hypothetical protein [Marinobacter sp. F4216]MBZ2168295.1 hypothetical protein [Marinobacter sp. F4216]